MKIRNAKQPRDGMATLVFITLLAIMMVLVTVEAGALFHLRRELNFLEQQQIQRLNPPATPSPQIK